MTQRLYYTEPWLREFDATILECRPHEGHHVALLDRTAFYPTSGGQPHDAGSIAGVEVLDVVEREDGRIAHVLAGHLPPGSRVEGRIDWGRRADHMQQHTGQHILSAAFHHLAGARTESFHLGTEGSTIDLARDVGPPEIAAAEDESNRIVWEDRAVTIRLVGADEAARLPLRKEPPREGRLRLIEVEDFDLSACGGTHVSRTGMIGTIVVRGWERFRGGTRVEFACGARALRAHREARDIIAAAIRRASVHPAELPDTIDRLQAENKEQRRIARDLAQRLAVHEAEALARSADRLGAHRVVVATLEGHDAAGLKALASAVASRPAHVAVLFSSERPAIAAAARHAGASEVDSAALLKALFQRFGGRGGGRPELAQGGGLDASADSLRAAVLEYLTSRAAGSR
jgi:alanyl-tRNA synthetase